MKTLAAIALLAAVAYASEEQCYFNGTVDWGDEADYAVVKLSCDDGHEVVDTLHVADPGGPYEFGWYTTEFVNSNEEWRVDCWLVLHGETVPTPKFAAGLTWPESFRYNQSYYCTICFEW
ncbi:hypothetical protein GX411_05765 [Candidatus Fermentibacteria bacterium]|nr:hypothetical protein [Candidatus Fermentibacteria bacterium]